MNTTENNKLIAEFMGLSKVYENESRGNVTVVLEEDNGFSETWGAVDAKYHTSWDWLMPVVLECFKKEEDVLDDLVFKLNDALVEANIHSLYKAVVEFIKWYNQNKDECT